MKNKIIEWCVRRQLNSEKKKGTIVGKIWQWFDGKKTVVGTAITVLAYIVGGIPTLAGFCSTQTCAANVAGAAGVGLTIVGLAHKAYKFIYREELK